MTVQNMSVYSSQSHVTSGEFKFLNHNGCKYSK